MTIIENLEPFCQSGSENTFSFLHATLAGDAAGVDPPSWNSIVGLDRELIEFNTLIGINSHEPESITETNGSHDRHFAVLSNESSLNERKAAPKICNKGSDLSQNLANLFVSLDNLTGTIPPMEVHDQHRSRGEKVPYFSLDHAFQLTEHLVEIYTFFVKTLTQINARASIISHADGSHDLRLSSDLIGNLTKPLSSDHATILLLLSCHHRLIDMWEYVFQHLAKVPIATIGEHCLKFNIGKFQSSSTPLEVIMIVEFASNLRDLVRELVTEVGKPTEFRKQGDSESTADSIVNATVSAGNAVADRADSLLEHATQMRRRIDHERKTRV